MDDRTIGKKWARSLIFKVLRRGDDPFSRMAPLTLAARALGVSLHTAKTHLQRNYDKPGFRVQLALIRLLLKTTRRGSGKQIDSV